LAPVVSPSASRATGRSEPAVQIPLAHRSAAMGQVFVDRVVGSLDVEEREGLRPRLPPRALPGDTSVALATLKDGTGLDRRDHRALRGAPRRLERPLPLAQEPGLLHPTSKWSHGMVSVGSRCRRVKAAGSPSPVAEGVAPVAVEPRGQLHEVGHPPVAAGRQGLERGLARSVHHRIVSSGARTRLMIELLSRPRSSKAPTGTATGVPTSWSCRGLDGDCATPSATWDGDPRLHATAPRADRDHAVGPLRRGVKKAGLLREWERALEPAAAGPRSARDRDGLARAVLQGRQGHRGVARQGLVVQAGTKTLALFNVEGAYHAIDNTCPNRGGRWARGSGRPARDLPVARLALGRDHRGQRQQPASRSAASRPRSWTVTCTWRCRDPGRARSPRCATLRSRSPTAQPPLQYCMPRRIVWLPAQRRADLREDGPARGRPSPTRRLNLVVSCVHWPLVSTLAVRQGLHLSLAHDPHILTILACGMQYCGLLRPRTIRGCACSTNERAPWSCCSSEASQASRVFSVAVRGSYIAASDDVGSIDTLRVGRYRDSKTCRRRLEEPRDNPIRSAERNAVGLLTPVRGGGKTAGVLVNRA